MNPEYGPHREILQRIARRVMLERGLLPDFSKEALAEVEEARAPAAATDGSLRDLTGLIWASIDNDDSLDLDQLTVAEEMPGGGAKILVAVADVDSRVKRGSAVDAHARHNTTSVYTAAEIFPMLPELFSTDLTSLNPYENRAAIVIEMLIDADGTLRDSDIYRARVRNHAKLAFNSVAAWLDGTGEAPEAIRAVNGLEENLRLQDRIARSMKEYRHTHGALSLETIEARAVFDGDELCDLQVEIKNRARDIIEDFMIGANGVTARFLSSRNLPSIRRVVRVPKRWDRIVGVAADRGHRLPDEPDSKALEQFLLKERAADPLRFPDLALTIVKLLGSGEYIAQFPNDAEQGHFGLAVKAYSHTTAPNRRYPDLITQRILKSALDDGSSPYDYFELEELARHCTEQEDAADKVERQVGKSAAALLLESRIGEQFDAVVTGASYKGTWARLPSVPAEGKLVRGFQEVDVGDQIRVELMEVDVERGYIDLARVG